MGRPLITVFGAGGLAGCAVAHALLGAPGRPWRVRAVLGELGELGSAATRALAEQGAEILLAALDEPASVRRALQGADAAFCTTPPRSEWPSARAHAQTLADALRQAPLRHAVWCSGSAAGPQAARCLGAERPVTLLRHAFLWDWLLAPRWAPRRGAGGVLELRLPVGRLALPGIGAADFGRCAAALFSRPAPTHGRRLWLAAERLQGGAIAARLGTAFGEPVRFVPQPATGCAGGSRAARRAIARARQLNPALSGFDAWARAACGPHGP